MSITNQNSVLYYSGNESTVTPYPITFRFLAASDIQVRSVTTGLISPGPIVPFVLEEGVDYNLIVHTDSNNVIIGGSITTTDAWSSLATIIIYRASPLTQLTELPEFGPFPANALELGLDKVTMIVQQLDRAVKRCFRVSDFAPAQAAAYPMPNTVLGVGADSQMRSYTGNDLLAMIQLPGALVNAPTAYWLNSISRPSKRPDFKGQFGLQMDDGSIWYSYGTGLGEWGAYALNDPTLSNTSHPPTAATVKTYVDTEAAAKATAAETAAKSYADGLFAGITPHPTGVMSPFALSTVPAGWVLASGNSIGNASSNGTERANADCHDLFVALWNDWAALPIYPSDSTSPTSRGANAEADWVANKRLALPDLRGRVPAGKDNMGGTSANRLTNSGTGNPGVEGVTLGAVGGAEKHQLTVGQMPSHSHTHAFNPNVGTIAAGSQIGANTGSLGTSAGGDQAHPNVQPTIVLNYIIKL